MNEKDSDEFKSTPVSKEHENENEFYPLQTSESIEIVNSKSKKNLLQNKFKFLDNFLYLLFILAINYKRRKRRWIFSWHEFIKC
jgi:hypothetical protein